MFGGGEKMFRDRAEAGRRLAERLSSMSLGEAVVLALPRGGVVVAAEVARALSLPLDVIVVRKLGAPHQPELAVGAVAGAEEPRVVRNERVIGQLGISDAELDRIKDREVAELRRRESAYRESAPAIDLKDKTAVVVDDGIATGMTTRAALEAARGRGASRVVLAVPVAPAETVAALREEVDDLVCLHSPRDFMAVGQFYGDFAQTTDEQVRSMLAEASAGIGGAGSGGDGPGREGSGGGGSA